MLNRGVDVSVAAANEEVLQKYLAAYIEGLRWALEPEHKSSAAKLISDYLKIDLDVATEAFAKATDPATGGLAKDAAFDIDGFRNALAIRTETVGKA